MPCRESPPEPVRNDKDNKPGSLLQPTAPRHYRSALRAWVTGLLLGILIAAAADRPGTCQDPQSGTTPQPSLRASALAGLAASAGSASNLGHAFPLAQKLVLGGPSPDSPGLTAFEENSFFVYAATALPGSGSLPGADNEPARKARLLRRVIFLKPSVFVVDDEVSTTGSQAPPSWRLSFSSERMPETKGQQARIREGESVLVCETLLPKNVTLLLQVCQGEGCRKEQDRFLLKVVAKGSPTRTRFLHVLSVGERGYEEPRTHSALVVKDDQLILTISTEKRVYHLELPPLGRGAGRIEVVQPEGEPLLHDRPFPAGILPHDPEGIRRLDQWDADYRGKTPPMWDIGRPSKELKKVVEERAVHPCRAADLCCGTGTDAIYLAGRGFKVTAIDIAPTALSQAHQKARKAGVSVQWLLADVLALPNLEPFDFIYDRGCYHVVRDQNLADYLETVRRLSHPGTQFLLLASRQGSQSKEEGPPGVTEEELRFDFLQLFDVEWIRESRLEANRPSGLGPPSWAALLLRKAKSDADVQGDSTH